MRLKIFGGEKRSQKPSLKSRGSMLMHWDNDIAIVFDPIKQKFFKDSITKIKEEEHQIPFQAIDLPRTGNSFECYVQAKNADQKVLLGTIDLSKLGKTINLHRARGHVPHLYIVGNVEVPE